MKPARRLSIVLVFILYSKATLCKAGEARHCIPFRWPLIHPFVRFLPSRPDLNSIAFSSFLSLSSLVISSRWCQLSCILIVAELRDGRKTLAVVAFWAFLCLLLALCFCNLGSRGPVDLESLGYTRRAEQGEDLLVSVYEVECLI